MPRSAVSAFISDIHSNLEALEAVLRETEGLEKFCLGDLVGYGANPNEVLDRLRDAGVQSVLGNHDYAVLTGDVGDFNSRAAVAVSWTASRLTEANMGLLRSLPRERTVSIGKARLYITHGSPDDNLWEYVSPVTHSDVFGYYLGRLEVKGIALGHSHVPFLWRGAEGVVFNPGSVGQPRDGDRRASYALVREDEDGKVLVELRRVEYDIGTAAGKILREGLPAELARRLYLGW